MSGKDPITCHILDTSAGRPAKAVPVQLTGPSSSSTAATHTFQATTDEDGRIKQWTASSDISTSAGDSSQSSSLSQVLDQVEDGRNSRWTLKFDTESYFGVGNTFFPEAVVVFTVEKGQTYHVPLLLSPFSYTTYRGS